LKKKKLKAIEQAMLDLTAKNNLQLNLSKIFPPALKTPLSMEIPPRESNRPCWKQKLLITSQLRLALARDSSTNKAKLAKLSKLKESTTERRMVSK